MTLVRFDDSLPAFVTLLRDRLEAEEFRQTTVIRDAKGVLGAIVDMDLDADKLDSLCTEARDRLGGYARTEAAVRDRTAPGARALLKEEARSVRVGDHRVRLLDRRIIGADWLATPAPLATACPRIVFYSVKGGVGRSTALAVAAAHLAGQGLRVLAVDLDLEAPGLGSTLLTPETMPRFGAVDWFVEDGITGIDATFRNDAIGPSWLGGGVNVLPAFGTETTRNPANALAKIARASIEDMSEDGAVIPFRDQVSRMINACEATDDHDVILIDGRAGLHEITAAPLLTLGARVLLFGLDEPQTFLGYRFLLAHIDQHLAESAAWRDRAWFVHAKAPAGDPTESEKKFRELWENSESDIIGDEPSSLRADDLDVEWADQENLTVPLPTEPVPVLRILDDSRYRNFSPRDDRALLTPELYRSTFGEILDWLDQQVQDVSP